MGGNGAARRGARIVVQLLVDYRTHNVMVTARTKGGPAATVGVYASDAIVKVGIESMDATNAKVVTVKCRGELERITKSTQLQLTSVAMAVVTYQWVLKMYAKLFLRARAHNIVEIG